MAQAFPAAVWHVVAEFLMEDDVGSVQCLNNEVARVLDDEKVWLRLLQLRTGLRTLTKSDLHDTPREALRQFLQHSIRWSRVPRKQGDVPGEGLPENRWMHRSAGNYVFGGKGSRMTFNDLWRVEIEEGQATYQRVEVDAGIAPPARSACGFVDIGTRIGAFLAVFGGRGGDDRYLGDMWVLEPVVKDHLPVWREVPRVDGPGREVHGDVAVEGPTPGERWMHSMTAFRSGFLMFGGAASGQVFDDLWLCDIHRGQAGSMSVSWGEIEVAGPKPCPRAGHAAASSEEYPLIISGGMLLPPAQMTVSDVWTLMAPTNGITHWVQVEIQSPLCARIGHSAGVMGDRLVVFGGRSPSPMGGGTTSGFSATVDVVNVKTGKNKSISTAGSCSSPLRTGHAMLPHASGFAFFGGMNKTGGGPQRESEDILLLHAF
mmetsp:Transcript_35913/g.86455  ORF Transcript_35913/g.86455 Transcript_35913/m.86455 type:complete len:430 (-) Transcript_35913:247-1536(-)